MNEILLLIVVSILFITVSYLVKKLLPLQRLYIKLASLGIVILLFAFDKEGNFYPKIIVALVILTSVYKEYLNLKKFKADRES